MAHSQFHQPSSEQLAAFCAGDPLAIDAVVTIVLPQIIRWALRKYANLPPEDVQETVYQVIAEICQQPARYDPARASFTTYVLGVLKLRLADTYRAHQKRAEHEESGLEAYENLLATSYYHMNHAGEDDVEVQVVRASFFRELEACLTPMELEIYQLMRVDTRESAPYANVLARHDALTGSPHDVKNAKARIIRFAKALANTLGYAPRDLL